VRKTDWQYKGAFDDTSTVLSVHPGRDCARGYTFKTAARLPEPGLRLLRSRTSQHHSPQYTFRPLYIYQRLCTAQIQPYYGLLSVFIGCVRECRLFTSLRIVLDSVTTTGKLVTVTCRNLASEIDRDLVFMSLYVYNVAS
jgi:hypothetical protein